MITCALATASSGVAPSAIAPGSSGISTSQALSGLLQVRIIRYLYSAIICPPLRKLCESIVVEDITDLLDLIGFGLAIAPGLYVENLSHPRHAEQMMIASNPLCEAHPCQDVAE